MAFIRETPKLKAVESLTHRWASLVGRDRVLDEISASDRPALVILGEPGIGKTRLLDEIRVRSDPRHDDYVYIGCRDDAANRTMHALVLIAQALQRRGRMPEEAVRTIIDSDERDRCWHFCESLERVLHAGRLVVQLDDVQRLDVASLDALETSIERFRDHPLVWHLAARAGSVAQNTADALERHELATVVVLDGLTRPDILRVARALEPGRRIDDTTLDRLEALTAGNPLYLDLYISQPTQIDMRHAPDIMRVAGEHLVGLSDGARIIGSLLAVQNGPLSLPAIASLVGLDVVTIDRCLAELNTKRIVEQTHAGHFFRHQLLREVWYAALEDQVRTTYHIELAHYVDDDWQRAGHFDAGGELDQAATAYIQLGWDRFDRNAPLEAMAAFDQAVERSDRRDERHWEARAGLAACLAACGRRDQAMAAIDAFEAASPRLNPRLRALGRGRYAEATWEHTQDFLTTIAFARSALQDANEAAPSLVPRLCYVLGAALERSDEIAEARAVLTHGISACDERVHVRERVRLTGWLGVVLGRAGDVHSGIALLERALHRAESFGLGSEVAQCCTKLCYLCDLIGDYDGFERWARAGLEAPGTLPNAVRALLLTNLAGALSRRGQLREALSLCTEATRSVTTANPTMLWRTLTQAATLHGMLDEFGPAFELLDHAAALDVSPQLHRATSYSTGVIHEWQGHYAAARVTYRTAVARSKGAAWEGFELRALVGLLRVSYLMDKSAPLGAFARMFRSATKPADLQDLGLQVEAYVCLSKGRVDEGCRHLIAASQTPAIHPFLRAQAQVLAADALGDRELFRAGIEGFECLGAVGAAERARALARKHGMRPRAHMSRSALLTDREAAVAKLVSAGNTNVEIGTTLGLSPRTVEVHVTSIIAKCGLRSRTDIAARLAAGTLS